MNSRILCVDDESALLKLYASQLKQFDVVIAESGEDGLLALKFKGPFAVVVSDLRMPKMNGAQFLGKVRQLAPSSVRLLMTGETDLAATLNAINEGNLFRFLTKPCPARTFRQAIEAAIEQHQLIIAEKELLEKTLLGSVEVLTEILSLVSPLAFGKAARIRSLVQQLGAELAFPNPWVLEVAVMLSQIGCVTIPDSILTKIYSGANLAKEEQDLFDTHPKIGCDLVKKIPRLEEVSQIIFHQGRRHDESVAVDDGVNSKIPFGARILHVALDCDELESTGLSRAASIAKLVERTGWYAPEVLNALEAISSKKTILSTGIVLVRNLQIDMILAPDLKNRAGALLAPKGQKISEALLCRLLNIVEKGNVPEYVHVEMRK